MPSFQASAPGVGGSPPGLLSPLVSSPWGSSSAEVSPGVSSQGSLPRSPLLLGLSCLGCLFPGVSLPKVSPPGLPPLVSPPRRSLLRGSLLPPLSAPEGLSSRGSLPQVCPPPWSLLPGSPPRRSLLGSLPQVSVASVSPGLGLSCPPFSSWGWTRSDLLPRGPRRPVAFGCRALQGRPLAPHPWSGPHTPWSGPHTGRRSSEGSASWGPAVVLGGQLLLASSSVDGRLQHLPKRTLSRGQVVMVCVKACQSL